MAFLINTGDYVLEFDSVEDVPTDQLYYVIELLRLSSYPEDQVGLRIAEQELARRANDEESPNWSGEVLFAGSSGSMAGRARRPDQIRDIIPDNMIDNAPIIDNYQAAWDNIIQQLNDALAESEASYKQELERLRSQIQVLQQDKAARDRLQEQEQQRREEQKNNLRIVKGEAARKIRLE